MAIYGVMRVEKRGRQALGGLEVEANRTADRDRGRFAGSEINWEHTKKNYHLVQTEGWWEHVKETVADAGAKIRGNSIVALDAVYTASSEYFEQASRQDREQFFQDCLEFHTQEYCHGDPELILNAVVHLDERTPHLQIASVPLTADGRLSAKEICGGFAAYHQRQDRFYETVCRDRGMDRGRIRDRGEQLKHRDQADWAREQAENQAKERVRELETLDRAASAAAERPGIKLGPIVLARAETVETLDRAAGARGELAEIAHQLGDLSARERAAAAERKAAEQERAAAEQERAAAKEQLAAAKAAKTRFNALERGQEEIVRQRVREAREQTEKAAERNLAAARAEMDLELAARAAALESEAGLYREAVRLVDPAVADRSELILERARNNLVATREMYADLGLPDPPIRPDLTAALRGLERQERDLRERER